MKPVLPPSVAVALRADFLKRSYRRGLHRFFRSVYWLVKLDRSGQRVARLYLRILNQSGGRNKACPCGSGRKLKHCCARRVQE